MRVPANVTELKQIIMTMSHRERFTFNVNPLLKQRFPEAEVLELYTTILWDVPEQPKNVNLKLCTMDGKMITDSYGKPVINKSKYFRLCTDKYLQDMFSILGSGVIGIE